MEILSELRQNNQPNQMSLLTKLATTINWSKQHLKELSVLAIPSFDTLCYLGKDLLPNFRSIKNASFVLNELISLTCIPKVICCSGIGGVGLCFITRENYAHIECDNEGEIELHIFRPTEFTASMAENPEKLRNQLISYKDRLLEVLSAN